VEKSNRNVLDFAKIFFGTMEDKSKEQNAVKKLKANKAYSV